MTLGTTEVRGLVVEVDCGTGRRFLVSLSCCFGVGPNFLRVLRTGAKTRVLIVRLDAVWGGARRYPVGRSFAERLHPGGL